jgi:hypothetical protein
MLQEPETYITPSWTIGVASMPRVVPVSVVQASERLETFVSAICPRGLKRCSP